MSEPTRYAIVHAQHPGTGDSISIAGDNPLEPSLVITVGGPVVYTETPSKALFSAFNAGYIRVTPNPNAPAPSIEEALDALDAKIDALNADDVGLTDAQLRASAVPVSISGTITTTGTLTDTQLRASPISVTGGLTDTQLRATALPISGSVTANAGIDLNTSALALETGGNLATIASKDFATQTTLAAAKTVLDNILTELNQKLEAGQEVALDSATLAALETISIANFPTDYADAASLAKLEQIRTLLAGTLSVSGSFSANVTVDNTDIVAMLTDLAHIMRSLLVNTGTSDSLGRMRANIETGTVAISSGTVTTVSTVTTVNTLNNVSNFGGASALAFVTDSNHSAWATALRGRIT